LAYYIVGRGNILLSQNVKLDEIKNVNIFEIDITFSMLPYCSLVVFYIAADGTINSDQTELKLSQDVMPTKVCPIFSLLEETVLSYYFNGFSSPSQYQKTDCNQSKSSPLQ
jgi:hypothetical protein